MVISHEQQEANRRNARKSTGPTTPEGKKAAALNAVTYGLRTRSLLIPGENIADYWRLWDDLENEWQPETKTERLYLEQMSVSQSLLARMARQRAQSLRRRPEHQSGVRSAGPHRPPHRPPRAFLHGCHARIEAAPKGAQGPGSQTGPTNQVIRAPASSAPERRDAGSQRRTSLLRREHRQPLGVFAPRSLTTRQTTPKGKR
jgi:hypothetical protein